MLHILCLILKVIGILLLAVLIFLLTVLALVLLVPVRYHVAAQKSPDANEGKHPSASSFLPGISALGEQKAHIVADGKMSWFLGMITLTAKFDGIQVKKDIRLFGHSLLHKKQRKKTEKKGDDLSEKTGQDQLPELSDQKVCESRGEQKKDGTDRKMVPGKKLAREREQSAEEKADVVSGDERMTNLSDASLEQSYSKMQDKGPAKKNETENRNLSRFSVRNTCQKIKQMLSHILQKMRGIRNHVCGINDQIRRKKDMVRVYLDFWHKSCTQAAKEHVLKELKYLLCHTRPRYLSGRLTIGFEDPAVTGEILGILCLLAVFTGNHLEINGNFEKSVLEGELEASGHIRLCHIVKAAIALLADKNIRGTVAVFRSLRA